MSFHLFSFQTSSQLLSTSLNSSHLMPPLPNLFNLLKADLASSRLSSAQLNSSDLLPTRLNSSHLFPTLFTKMLCTEVILHTEAVPRSKPLQRANFHTEAALTQKVLTQKGFCAEKFFFTQPAMTQRSTNGNLLHRDAFTHNNF